MKEKGLTEAWKRLSTSHETIGYQWSLEASETTVSQVSFRLFNYHHVTGRFLLRMCVWFVRYTSMKSSGLSRLSHNIGLSVSDLVFPAVAGSEHLRM